MADHPSFAVIIPAKNAARTLASCLEAVFQSSLSPAEVIVVNDRSSDGTAEIASGFPCRVLEVALERGPMPPRLAGARDAKAPIFIFVDADVRVKKDTFQKIIADFKNPGIHAVTGLLDRGAQDFKSKRSAADKSSEADSLVSSFFSVFKNEYMNYIFKRQPKDSRFLYGSLWAIRKECLIDFEPLDACFGGLVSDSELGFRLKRENRKILLDHELEVTHLKEYNFYRLLANDFQIPFSFAVLLLAYAAKNPLTRKKRFSHISLGQVMATGLAFTAFACLDASFFAAQPAFGYATALCLFFFYAHWLGFLKKLAETRGLLFTLKSFLFLPLDQAVMFCGMLAGLGYGLIMRKPLGAEASLRQPLALAPSGLSVSKKDAARWEAPLRASRQTYPLVSVMMLNFNYAPYLGAAIQSVVNQTYRNWELIVVDDGSQDGSARILEKFQNEYPGGVRVLRHPDGQNHGILKSFELALSRARGDVLAFLEADDLWQPENLKRKVLALTMNPEVGVVYSHYRPFGQWRGALYWRIYALANKLSTPKHKPFDAFPSLLYRNPVASFSHFAVRRSFLESLPQPSSFQRNLDWWILAHLSARASFYFLPEPLSFWRIHPASAGYGRVRLSTLWRLHHFLIKLYRSICQTAAQSRPQIDQALLLQNLIQARRIPSLLIKIFLHPLAFLRFMSYILLRNLLFTS